MNDTPRKSQNGKAEAGPLVQDQDDHFRTAEGNRIDGSASPGPDTIDRDAMGQADYGGRRDPSPAASPHEGGLSVDDASGDGRRPAGARDGDDGLDGARTRP